MPNTDMDDQIKAISEEPMPMIVFMILGFFVLITITVAYFNGGRS